MISVDKIEVFGWGAAIRGMRNPMNSWDKSDSEFKYPCMSLGPEEEPHYCNHCGYDMCHPYEGEPKYVLGPKDMDLMKRLIKAGREHRKFLRMIHVQMDITAPLYWWKEYDTYKISTVANSCSTMHKLTFRPLTWDDFSTEHLGGSKFYMERLISEINAHIQLYNETKNKDYWYAAVQLLPSSYNQKRTVDINYEVIMTMIRQRKGHKLDEWNDFVKMLETLPYMQELIK